MWLYVVDLSPEVLQLGFDFVQFECPTWVAIKGNKGHGMWNWIILFANHVRGVTQVEVCGGLRVSGGKCSIIL